MSRTHLNQIDLISHPAERAQPLPVTGIAKEKHFGGQAVECDLNQQKFAEVGKKLRALIDTNTDSVRCYRLDVTAVAGIQILGIGRVTVEEPYILVGRKT